MLLFFIGLKGKEGEDGVIVFWVRNRDLEERLFNKI